MKKLSEKINESFVNEAKVAKVADKDWQRMLDLVVSGKDSGSASKVMKDANKAMARFIAGLKLNRQEPKFNPSWKEYSGTSFTDFGDKAIELGATPEQIQALYDNTEVPEKWFEKKASLSGKKLNDRFAGKISKVVLDAGFNITYLPHNGYAMTRSGKDAMQRNGRKWTIGYKTEIDLGDRKVQFEFDAITDEGDGPTSFVLHNAPDSIFNDNFDYWNDGMTQTKFIAAIKKSLANVNK